MEVRFLSLGSGSSGNCYYLATKTCGILIDAGIGIRSIKKIFKDYALNLDTIRVVLITHDHADHIKAVGHFYTGSARRHQSELLHDRKTG